MTADSAATAVQARRGLIYVLAASHSGSTLLAMLLGAHRDACSVGALNARNIGDPARYRCSCGACIRECAFWQSVQQHMAARGTRFDITAAGTDVRGGASAFERCLLRPSHRGPVLERLRDEHRRRTMAQAAHTAATQYDIGRAADRWGALFTPNAISIAGPDAVSVPGRPD